MSSVSDIADELAADMPPPQEDAIAAETDKLKLEQRDKRGRIFDPAIHSTRDGEPILNADGTIRLKRGRGAGSVLAKPATTDPGIAIAEAIFTFGQMFGGEEWVPRQDAKYGIDERAQAHDAWQRYCEAKEITDIPPGIAITLCTLGYVVPRLFMPITKTRFQKARLWVVGKYVGWKTNRQSGSEKSVTGNG